MLCVASLTLEVVLAAPGMLKGVRERNKRFSSSSTSEEKWVWRLRDEKAGGNALKNIKRGEFASRHWNELLERSFDKRKWGIGIASGGGRVSAMAARGPKGESPPQGKCEREGSEAINDLG